MQPWKTKSKHTILAHSKYLTVEDHTVELPDGRVIERWPWVITPDFVNVAVETTEGTFLCFRQYKYAVGETLAVVGGYIEAGEKPLATAKRELLEETGHQATQWVDLGSYALGGNRGIATGYLFLAREARPVQEPDADDLEEQHLLWLSRDEVAAALAEGKFKTVTWAATMALALQHLPPRDV